MQFLVDQTLSFFGEYLFRSSCPELCYENGVLESFIKFAGKHMCWSFCYNTIAKLRPTNLLKERLQHRCCLENFAKLSRIFFGIPANDWFYMLTDQCQSGEKFACTDLLLIHMMLEVYEKEILCFVYKFKLEFVMILNYSLFTRLW